MNLKECLKNELKFSCSKWFKDNEGKPIQLTDYQIKIVRTILDREPKRNYCVATTRAGKSFALAIGICLLSVLNPNSKVVILAPTLKHTRIIMGYVVDCFIGSAHLTNELSFDMKGVGIERLKKELTKTVLTLRNGSVIRCLTADIKGKGLSVIGHGATDLFIDELEKIPSELIKSAVMRMLGDTPDSFCFFISNPHTLGYGYEKLTDPGWKIIRVDWKQCVNQGRLTQKFVEERRKEMTALEFKIMYEAEYPDATEDQLIPRSLIERAVREIPKYVGEVPERILGVDVARFGADKTVLMYLEKLAELYVVKEIKSFDRSSVNKVVGEVKKFDELIGFNSIVVDDAGVGGGVFDNLRAIDSLSEKAIAFNGGKAANKKYTEKFLNQKAQQYNRLKLLFEQGNIIIPDKPVLLNELAQIRYEFGENAKMKIVKARDGEKSPDYADALMMGCSFNKREEFFVLEGMK